VGPSAHYGGSRHRTGKHAFHAYAVLAPSLPPRERVYIGIFNFFIVTPEILASLFFGMDHDPFAAQ
jgi:hypothetical protein